MRKSVRSNCCCCARISLFAHRWRHSGPVADLRSLGEVQNERGEKVLALCFATVARLSTVQNIRQPSVRAASPSVLSARQTVSKRGQQERENSSSPSRSHHAFWKKTKQKKDKEHRQRYDHALTEPQTARSRELRALKMTSRFNPPVLLAVGSCYNDAEKAAAASRNKTGSREVAVRRRKKTSQSRLEVKKPPPEDPTISESKEDVIRIGIRAKNKKNRIEKSPPRP